MLAKGKGTERSLTPGQGRDEGNSAGDVVMIIEDVPNETKCGRGCGRG